ncbi:helix-turn-helix transcriptional regulator [Enterococcus sp. 5H]|uniref:helix-turn-helix transcriptional regulator n=1 Tax=Enterococcus sp. 5H TaxID=1229490 RepID=UPI002302E5C6|nr:YafY family protein [Enterococcus sp. 5H]MDA9471313.1 Transcriptional regulator, DeoR family [Enterococcus sp. 5H]
MKKIERILAIIVLLLDNEVVSATQLAQRFEVTKRTIFRDIETIELAGFPIISQPGRNGGFSLMNSFKLRTYTYNGEEKQDILNALNVKEGLFGLFDQKSTIKEKISALQVADNQQKHPQQRFSFASPTMHRHEIEVETKLKIDRINATLKENRKLKITYVDNKGEFTHRMIHPYELMLMNGSWYIYSYCETREDFRYFKVTRIRQLETQQTTFLPSNYTEKTITREKDEHIHLRFKKEDLGKLYDYYTDDEIEISESYINVHISTSQQQTILAFLLMFGDSVTVISPETLKKLHIQEIKKLNHLYS